jgi:rhodanese-related sulfurtransferase
MIQTLTPVALAEWLATADKTPPYLLDVREPHEVALCAISHAHCIPMTTVPQRLDDIPQDQPIVCICHHGGRSMRVAQFLAGQGYTQIFNLTGGIDLWAQHVEPTMTRY